MDSSPDIFSLTLEEQNVLTVLTAVSVDISYAWNSTSIKYGTSRNTPCTMFSLIANSSRCFTAIWKFLLVWALYIIHDCESCDHVRGLFLNNIYTTTVFLLEISEILLEIKSSEYSLRRMLFSRTWCRLLWYKFTDVSDKHAAFTFKIKG